MTTVDIDERFNPDIQADVFDLRPLTCMEETYGVILASPPCTALSVAGNHTDYFINGQPNSETARDHVALARHTLGLIKGLAPD